MKMPRHPDLVLFSLAAIHLLLFSICPVSSRIYETKDAVVIEVDLEAQPSIRSARSSSYRNPAAAMPYAFNPYYSALYQQQQPNFPFWPYPLLKPASSSAVSDVASITFSQPKQQILSCGVGPDSPPARQTPPVVGIVGGLGATPNSWPFIVGLRMVGKNSGNVFCGGSLISPTRILTAAHCVNGLTTSNILSMTVSLGMHTQGILPNTVNDAQQTRRVTRNVFHKDYDDKAIQNNIAMLTIEPPVVYSKDISPVCLAPASTAADQFVGKDAAIIGWGKLKSGGPQSDTLQQGTIQVISQAKCNEFRVSFNPITNQHVCAGAPGKDTCQGDSGGPMVAQMTDGSTSWTQIGVVSFGNSCPADFKKPRVYANVAFFRNWIDTYI